MNHIVVWHTWWSSVWKEDIKNARNLEVRSFLSANFPIIFRHIQILFLKCTSNPWYIHSIYTLTSSFSPRHPQDSSVLRQILHPSTLRRKFQEANPHTAWLNAFVAPQDLLPEIFLRSGPPVNPTYPPKNKKQTESPWSWNKAFFLGIVNHSLTIPCMLYLPTFGCF